MKLLIPASLIACLGLVLPASADTIRISGASTVADVVAIPGKAQVEANTGHQLNIAVTNTGRGLIALTNGLADMAMVSEPLDIAAEAVKATGEEFDASNIKMHIIRKDEVVFVVHPSNAISTLNWEQLRGILSGKLKNWKDVGGKDEAISVFTEGVTGGTRNLVRKAILKEDDFSPSSNLEGSVETVAKAVARTPSGIGCVGRSFASKYQVKVLKSDKVERPLGFATIGPASSTAQAVIEAYKAIERDR